MVLAMAVQAATHRMSDLTLRNGRLSHVAVTGRAGNVRLIVRRMLESHECLGRESVNTFPRDFMIPGGVGDHFLHFRIVPSELLVTQHALRYGRDSSPGAHIRTAVTIKTIEPKSEVLLMGILDRLASRRGHGK
jgi:hypothetical protein